MNRHRNFYNKLEDELGEFYDDYYEEEEEEEYYTEDELQYIVATGASSGNTNNNFTLQKEGENIKNETNASLNDLQGLNTNDMDYALLIKLVPEFKEKWSEMNAKEKCNKEISLQLIVEAIRECNYEVNEAIIFAIKKSNEIQKEIIQSKINDKVSPTKIIATTKTTTTSMGGRTLKIGQNKKEVTTDPIMKKSNSSDEEKISNNNNNNANNNNNNNKISNGSKVTDHKNKKENIKDIMPDQTKKDCTFVIAGHVDAGKSTTIGHLLLLLGKVSQAEVDKNEKNARQLQKESFKYAWLLDQSEEERRRGVTIDSGSYCFETKNRRIHILDAPGHKDYVINMISSATQADAALLVVTAATSEFEVGIKHGTREHLLNLKTLGVGSIVVAINKMDTIEFSQERYNYIVEALQGLMKRINFKEETIVGFCPISGMKGTNICEIDHNVMPWYNGPSLVELLDCCPLESRLLDAPLRISLQDVGNSKLFCKVESGKVQKSSHIIFIPSDIKVHVKSIIKPTIGGLVDIAFAGDTIEIDTDSSLVGLRPGCVGCNTNTKYDNNNNTLIRSSTTFKARVQTFPSLQESILPGSVFTMIVHALQVQVRVVQLISKLNNTNDHNSNKGEWSRGMVKCIPKNTQALIIFQAEFKIALEPAVVCRALGRFVLLQGEDTVAGGLVEEVGDVVLLRK